MSCLTCKSHRCLCNTRNISLNTSFYTPDHSHLDAVVAILHGVACYYDISMKKLIRMLYGLSMLCEHRQGMHI
jgi:hypothetical protein